MSSTPHDPKKKPPEAKENLSFQALQEEMGDLPIPPKPEPEPPEAAPETPTPKEFKKGQRESAPVGDDELNKRVLTGSAPKSNPMWLKGIWPGVAGLLLCVLLFTNEGVQQMQPFFSYGVMVVGGFTLIWGADGLRRSDWNPKERYLCGVPFVMGLITLVLAFFNRT